MRKKILRCIIFVIILTNGITISQSIYDYNFGTGTGSYVTAGSSNQLTSPPSGNAYVYIASGVNGGVQLKNPGITTFGTGSKIMLHSATSAGSVNKFSIYGHNGGTNSYVKFTISFADSVGGSGITSGTFYFCTGNGGSFSNNSGLSPSDIVTGLRWTFSGTGTVTTDAIKSGNSWRQIDINPFYQGEANVYIVEVFGNNGSYSNGYIYNGTDRTVASEKQDIYINGVLCADDADISSNGLPVNTNVNSFMFFAENNKPSNLCAFIDDISYATGIAPYYLTYINYYSKSTGNLDLLSSWTTNLDGSGNQYPPDFAGDLTNGGGKIAMIFNLKNRSTATMGNNWTISGQNCKLNVGDSINSVLLTIPSNYTFTSTSVNLNNNATLINQSTNSSSFGSFTIYSGGTYQHNCNGGTIPSGTWNVGSILRITGTTNTAPAGLGQTFNNFIWNCTSQSSNVNLGGVSGFGVIGDMTVSSTGGVSGRALQLTNSSLYSVPVTGNLVLNGGHLAITSGSGSGTLNVSGNITLSNSSELYLSHGGSSDGFITLNGNLVVNSGTLITETGSSTGHTIYFSNTGSQSFTNQGTISNDINYSVGVNSLLSFNNDIPVNLGMNFSVNGILYFGTNNLIGSGNFILSSGGTISIGSPDGITNSSSAGNIRVTGSRTYNNNANYIYSGAVAQAMGEGFPGTVNNFTLNNSNDINLTRSITINGTLNFTTGKINIGSSDLTIGSSGTISGYSLNSYINTGGTGLLKRTVTSSSIIFPIGNGSYTPVTLLNSGTLDVFGVKVKNTFDNAPLTNCVINKQWNIEEQVIGGSNVSVSLQWNATDEDPGFVRGNSLYIGHWNGSYWEAYLASGGVSGSGPYTISLDGFTSFSPFAIGNAGALPVELLSFTSSTIEKSVYLHWTTGLESNNIGFEIERKNYSTGHIWEKIGFVKGNGTVNHQSEYTYCDKNLSIGKYSYRLKQIDNNGNFKYFELGLKIDITNPKSFKLTQNYPNPFNPKTKIDFQIPIDAKVILEVYDITGRKIKTLINSEFKKADYYTVDFNAENFASGIYFYRIEADKYTETKKMILIK